MAVKIYLGGCLKTLLIFMYFGITTGLQLPMQNHTYIGAPKVKVSDPNIREKRVDECTGCSSELDVDVTLNGSEVTLHLLRNNNVSPSVPVYVSKNGLIKKLNLPPTRTTAFYQDVANDAYMELECTGSKGSMKCRHLVSGHFRLKNQTFMMAPVVLEESRDHTDDVTHAVYQTHGEYNFTSDYLESGSTYTSSHDLNKMRNDTIPHYRSRRSVVNHKVEFLPVIDYSIYKFWYDRSNATTTAAKDLNAKENIREFYALILNGVDLRYKTLVSSTISIDVVYAGILIADDPTVSPWTESIKITGPTLTQVDAHDALDAFGNWLAEQTSLPEYDHAMAFTRYKLRINGSTPVAGLGWISGACDHARKKSNSISEDHFEACVARVAAHELGHNLGSKHDGDGNTCSAVDNYVMSTRPYSGTDAKGLNHYTFSSCTVKQFKTYFDTLDSKGNNCLLTLSSTFDPKALDPYFGLEAGQLYDADTQCEMIAGSGSYVCRSLYTDFAEICAELWCSIPGIDSCRALMTWEGTTCGNKKLCRSGVCTCDQNAPSVPDNCALGDTPGANVDGLDCTAYIANKSYSCYDTAYSWCCDTCNKKYYIGVKDCEYGDHYTDCVNSSCSRYNEESRTYGCCKTCGGLLNTSSYVAPPSSCVFTTTVAAVTVSPAKTSSASTKAAVTSTTVKSSTITTRSSTITTRSSTITARSSATTARSSTITAKENNSAPVETNEAVVTKSILWPLLVCLFASMWCS